MLRYILLAIGISAYMRADYRENYYYNNKDESYNCAFVAHKTNKRILPIALRSKVGVNMSVSVVMLKLKSVFRQGGIIKIFSFHDYPPLKDEFSGL